MDVFAAPTTVYPSFTSWRAGVQRGSEFPGYIRGGWFPPGSCASHGTRTERGRVFYGKHIDFVGICVSFAYVAVGCHGRVKLGGGHVPRMSKRCGVPCSKRAFPMEFARSRLVRT